MLLIMPARPARHSRQTPWRGAAMNRPALGCVALALLIAACSSTPGEVVAPAATDVKDGTFKFDVSGGETLSDGALADGADPADVSFDVTTVVQPGEFGWPCKDLNDCNNGLCVQSYSGKMCSHSCESADCEPGFSCQQVTTNGVDTIWACVPKFKHICEPCGENLNCNDPGESTNVCISFGEVGSFCGATCDPTASDCPANYACETVINPATGAKVSQCKHKGICECSQKAKVLGLSTKCSIHNDYGTCNGVRQCGTDGLAECSAAVPELEKCDNVDNDCNGYTDDFTASSKCPIVNPAAPDIGTCMGVIKQCVNGQPVCEGKMPIPEQCNGLDDNCDGVTDEGLCQDGDPCTKDTCNTDGSCQHIQLGGLPCDDGSLCTQTDKCISGKCVGGDALNCDDQDPCTTDTCDPFTGCKKAPASGATCPDDGVECTADTCKNGKCEHYTQDGLKCASDGKPCTDDLCVGQKCTHPNSTAACDDGNACTAGDKCSGGKCLPGPAPGCDDGNPCTSDKCDPNVAGGCTHDNNDFAACTSSSGECPIGQCAAGQCFPLPNSPCSVEVDLGPISGLCGTQKVAGACVASGTCVATKKYDPSTCTTPCSSFCINCGGIQVCLDFLFNSTP